MATTSIDDAEGQGDEEELDRLRAEELDGRVDAEDADERAGRRSRLALLPLEERDDREEQR